MDNFEPDNNIIEINSEQAPEEKVPFVNEENKDKQKVLEKKVKEKKPHKSLSKKQKIIIGVIAGIIVLAAVIVILILFVFPKKEKKEEPKEDIVIVKDNYKYENGSLVFQDKSNRTIGSYDCIIKDDKSCFVSKLDYSKDTFERILSVDKEGKEITKNTKFYFNNFVFINDDNKMFLFDIKAKKNILDVKTVKTYGTEKELVVFENPEGKYGVIEINQEGFNYIIRPSYDYLGIINTKLVYLLAYDKEEKYIINNDDKKISKNIFADVKSVNDKYIVALKNNKYNLYSYDFEELISDYDYIGLHDDIISVVKKNRLYLYDSDLNKLYEEGIRLDNSDYVKKYIYEDNKLIETKKSYEITSKNNVVAVVAGDTSKSINMYEGVVSSNYEFVNYFDGKLYFYSDLDCTDLIGTYTCNNKNTIDSSDVLLKNCYVYENESGYSGIYNSDYVFIYDNMIADDSNIYLYSLKEKKVKGTYSELEFINSEDIGNRIRSIYTSSSHMIVKAATGTNKGNYGVIEITSNKVTGKLPFKYKSIEKEKDYYVTLSNDGLYTLYNDKFLKSSYDFNYIKYYDNYYAGIINNKLNIYKYGNIQKILSDDVPVTNNDFTISFNNGYIITVGDNTYEYDINGKLKVEEPENTENSENNEATVPNEGEQNNEE
jgi:hypothetical protein